MNITGEGKSMLKNNSRYSKEMLESNIDDLQLKSELDRIKTEVVENPQHYGGKDNPYEAIKVIDAWNLGFSLGNCVKYISRAGKKDKLIQELYKARWYLNHEIEKLEKEEVK